MQSQFEQLLDDIGKELKAQLKPDSNHSCILRFKEGGAPVQIEEKSNLGELVIGALIGKLSAGPYRDKVFKAALLINGAQQPGIKGTLAYGEHTEQLYLCDSVDMFYTTAKLLIPHLKRFSLYAAIWITALESNTIPDLHDLGIYEI